MRWSIKRKNPYQFSDLEKAGSELKTQPDLAP